MEVVTLNARAAVPLLGLRRKDILLQVVVTVRKVLQSKMELD